MIGRDPYAWCQPTGIGRVALWAFANGMGAKRLRYQQSRARETLRRALTSCLIALAYAPILAVVVRSILWRYLP